MIRDKKKLSEKWTNFDITPAVTFGDKVYSTTIGSENGYFLSFLAKYIIYFVSKKVVWLNGCFQRFFWSNMIWYMIG